MGYVLYAFIGKKEVLIKLQGKYSQVKICNLQQNISLIPMTGELYDEINNFISSDDINSFAYLTTNVEKEVLQVIEDSPLAYIEAEYFGSNGGQRGIIWKENQRHSILSYSHEAINKVLQFLGVSAQKRRDEFDTIGLGRFREMEEWIEASE